MPKKQAKNWISPNFRNKLTNPTPKCLVWSQDHTWLPLRLKLASRMSPYILRVPQIKVIRTTMKERRTLWVPILTNKKIQARLQTTAPTNMYLHLKKHWLQGLFLIVIILSKTWSKVPKLHLRYNHLIWPMQMSNRRFGSQKSHMPLKRTFSIWWLIQPTRSLLAQLMDQLAPSNCQMTRDNLPMEQ